MKNRSNAFLIVFGCVFCIVALFVISGSPLRLPLAQKSVPADPTKKNPSKERDFVLKVTAHKKKHKAILQEIAEAPLDEVKQRLLNQLLAIEGMLDAVLSTPEYLVYLNLEIEGDRILSIQDETKTEQHLERLKSNQDSYPSTIAKMPVPEQEERAWVTFKDLLPSDLTEEQQHKWLAFYFKMCEIYATEPNIFENEFGHPKVMFAMADFGVQYVKEPKTAAEKPTALAELDRAIEHSKAPLFMAKVSVQVHHDVWEKKIKRYGIHEGLLRAAITTPSEFALIRSFFQDSEAFEKWVSEPLKRSDLQGTEAFEKQMSEPLKILKSLKSENGKADTN